MGDKSMAQEEETQRYCNINGGNNGSDGVISIANIGRSSKKQKPKKVPQRGLGVAQLEKIRLEEQQKQNDGGVASVDFLQPPPSPPLPPVSQPAQAHAHSLNGVSVPNYHSLDCSVTLPSGDLFASTNSIIRSQNLEIVDPNCGVQLGWQSIVPKMRSQKDSGADHGLVLAPNFNSHDPVLPLPMPNLMQRSQAAQQHQQSLRCLAMTSMSIAGCLPSSSSVLRFHTEPPSNQSFYGNFLPAWPEEEKMVGMKRAYPFSLDNPPDQSFRYNFPRVVRPVSNRADESVSIGNEIVFNSNLEAPNFREGFSRSNSNMDLEPNSSKRNKTNSAFSGDFLTLAPPTPTKIGSSSNLKGSSAFNPVRDVHNFDHNQSGDQIHQTGTNLRHLHHCQPFYSFLPQRNMQVEGRSSFGNNGEVGEGVIDLTLKL